MLGLRRLQGRGPAMIAVAGNPGSGGVSERVVYGPPAPADGLDTDEGGCDREGGVTLCVVHVDPAAVELVLEGLQRKDF